METLILLRHAKAVRDHEAESDEARQLTQDGRAAADAAARALTDRGFAPDVILASPAARTRETAEIVAVRMPQARIAFVDELYMAEPDAIWRAAHAAEAETVLLVGHNPGLHELACDFVRQAHDRSKMAILVCERFPTAAWAAFAIGGSVRWAAAPRLIAASAA